MLILTRRLGETLMVGDDITVTLGVDSLKVVTDRGYYNGAEIRACDEDGIDILIPKTQTSGNQAKGLFGKQSIGARVCT